jgi:hypothetical protein
MSRRTPDLRRLLGRGPGFPFAPRVGAGSIPLVDGPEKVRESIWIILDTEPGERIMRPQFGCGLRRYLMKPNTPATRALIQRDVERALANWEPRIQVSEVRVEPAEDPAMVLIQIRYQHRRDGSPASLVYPFYLE